MNSSWTELARTVLTPARPRLSQCRTRAATHALAERALATAHTAALQACQARIEAARAQVFDAGDGVVDTRMTALEREWRVLAGATRSVEARTLALWNDIAPSRWTGTLRWAASRDLEAEATLAVTLASDPDGVERAEQCAVDLARALDLPGAPAITWELFTRSTALSLPWLDALAHEATSTLAMGYGGAARLARAEASARAAHEATADARLADVVAQATLADFCWQAGAAERRPTTANPSTPLAAVWRTGYCVVAADAERVVLGAVPA